jgi:hypothetical protein
MKMSGAVLPVNGWKLAGLRGWISRATAQGAKILLGNMVPVNSGTPHTTPYVTGKM